MVKLILIDKSNFLKIPNVRQSNSYSCGAACLLAILAHYNKFEGNEDQLADQLNTNSEDGTNPESIVKIAKKYGLKSNIKNKCTINDLNNYVNTKTPVIINYQAWTNKKKVNWENNETDGHYSILIGVDDKNVYFNDPSLLDKKGYIPIKEFMDRWHDEGYERMCIVFEGNKDNSKQKIVKIK